MRLAVALGLFLASSTSALAQDFCKDAPLDIFKFVRWEVKAADKHIVEINMTFHNNLDQSFSGASFGMNILDKQGKLVKWQSLEVQEDVLAGVDHAEIYRLDAPPKLAEELKGTTPVLCVYVLIDAKTGKRTTYLKADPSNPPKGPDYTKPEDVKSPVPFPADAKDITFSAPAHLLRYTTPQNLAQMTDFYRAKFKDMGWGEKNRKAKDQHYEAEFDSANSEWVQIELEAEDAGTKVTANGPYTRN